MEPLLNLVMKSIEQVWLTLQHNWPFLVLSVAIATALKLFLDPEKISAFLDRHRRAGVIAPQLPRQARPSVPAAPRRWFWA